jgi:N-acetylglucosamine-6-phosphate deacetylase
MLGTTDYGLCTYWGDALPQSQTPDMYEQIIPALHHHAVDSLTIGAAVIGYHLEGPFLAPSKIGCHPAGNARDASEGWRSFIGTYGQTIVEPAEELKLAKIITVAPEVLGVMDCIPRLVEEGFTISIGHSYVARAT